MTESRTGTVWVQGSLAFHIYKRKARSSWLSSFCDKKALSQESPLSALLQDWGPRRKDRWSAECSFCNPREVPPHPHRQLPSPSKSAEDRAAAEKEGTALSRSSTPHLSPTSLTPNKKGRKAAHCEQRFVHMQIRGSVSTVQLVIKCPKRTLHTSPHTVTVAARNLCHDRRAGPRLLPRPKYETQTSGCICGPLTCPFILEKTYQDLCIKSYKHLPQIQVYSNFLKIWGKNFFSRILF